MRFFFQICCKTDIVRYLGSVILAIVTISFFNGCSPFEDIGPELLVNGSFKADPRPWEYAGENGEAKYFGEYGGVNLISYSTDRVISLKQDLLGPFSNGLIRLRGLVKVYGGSNDEDAVGRARVVLLSLNYEGLARYDKPHVLYNRKSTSDWEACEHVFAIEPNAGKIRVALQLLHFAGTLAVESLSLHYVKINPQFEVIRKSLIILWCIAVVIWVFPMLCYRRQGWRCCTIVVWSIAIMVGILMPESQKMAIGSLLQTSLIASDGPIDWLGEQKFDFTIKAPAVDIFKQGHFWMFAILSWMIQNGKCMRLNEVFSIILFAFVTEVLQLFVQARTPNITDVLVDISGAGLGMTAYYLYKGTSKN